MNDTADSGHAIESYAVATRYWQWLDFTPIPTKLNARHLKHKFALKSQIKAKFSTFCETKTMILFDISFYCYNEEISKRANAHHTTRTAQIVPKFHLLGIYNRIRLKSNLL